LLSFLGTELADGDVECVTYRFTAAFANFAPQWGELYLKPPQIPHYRFSFYIQCLLELLDQESDRGFGQGQALGERSRMLPGSISTEFGKGSKQTEVSDPYRTSMNNFLGVFAKSNSAGAKPEEVAKVIYRAANDPGNRLRHLAKPGPFFWMNRILPDAVWRRLLMKVMVQ
jgi:hypothetical protein